MSPEKSPLTFPHVRTATIEDLNAIVTITNRAFLCEQFCVTGDRTDATDIGQRFEIGNFFVVDDPENQHRMLGSVFCSFENSRGYLGLLSVDPDAQGQGHSRLLVEAVEQYCRAAGCNFLDITVVNIRGELFPYYTKLGFAAFDLVPFPVPERAKMPLQLVRMTKALLAPKQMAIHVIHGSNPQLA